ncbi:MAG TPA: adenylate/guanylate cyclase domain-containing protein [Pseudomonadales bacterium]|nr:adenylate/guanylate cyclase domain-containing protein [Pseudomonadales bacterium]
MNRHDFAIMFADVSGSSRLYKEVGDNAARALIAEAVSRMISSVNSHGGTVIKTIGDEVMARFPTAEAGISAAIAMQQQSQIPIKGQILPLRIGVNFGSTILDNNDVFGEAVNDSAALVKIARARQIVTNAGTISKLPAALQGHCSVFDHVVLKGGLIEEAISLVNWETSEDNQSDRTIIKGMSAVAIPAATNSLKLRYFDLMFEITAATTPFKIGRDARHITIDSNFSSRDHCSVEFRRGKFVLIDHSTNGTYVKFNGSEELYLRREELPLTGSGQISIGQPTGTAAVLTIEFQLSN